MSRNADLLLQVDYVIVMEDGYKVYEGDLSIICVPPSNDDERAAAADGCVFGICGDYKFPLTKKVKIEKHGVGRFEVDILGKELCFILPDECKDTELIEDTLISLSSYSVSTSRTLDKGVPCQQVEESSRTSSPTSSKKETDSLLSGFLASASAAKSRLMNTRVTSSGEKPASPKATGKKISESLASSLFDVAKAVGIAGGQTSDNNSPTGSN